MSFREKSAWITFIALLAFGIYFGEIAQHLLDGAAPRVSYFPLFLGLVAALVVLEVVMHIAIAMRSPQDARTPRDERERALAQRATVRAYYVLLVGAFAAIGTMHLGANAWLLAHAALFAVWVAELTRYASLLYDYRQGAKA